ncbi:MAG: c-type cytochrome [Rhodospirillaceae bacterium]|nr:c-type cytochrome [Rhodospirillaceae bacterium]
MNCVLKLTVAIALAWAGLAGPASADIAKGEKNFKRCKACHSLTEGKNLNGPSLHKIYGRKAASVPKFRYSKGLKQAAEKGLVWERETLMAYLKHPKKFLQKYLGKKRVSNKMVNKFKKEKFRRDVIDYLESLGK